MATPERVGSLFSGKAFYCVETNIRKKTPDPLSQPRGQFGLLLLTQLSAASIKVNAVIGSLLTPANPELAKQIQNLQETLDAIEMTAENTTKYFGIQQRLNSAGGFAPKINVVEFGFGQIVE